METTYISVRNLQPDMGEETIRPLFKKFGRIEKLTIEPDGTATIGYKKTVSVPNAVAAMNNALYGGRRIQVVPAGAPMEKIVSNKLRTICRQNARGLCKLGSKCRYAHPEDEVELEARKSEHVAKHGKSVVMCRTVQLGAVCIRGDACNFSHDPNAPTSASVYGSVPCKNILQKGMCRHGDKCRFSHDAAVKPAAPVKRTAPTSAAAPAKKLKIAPVANTAPVAKIAKTEPITKAATSSAVMCAECTKSPATLACEQCAESFCAACDAAAHGTRVMSKHVRTPLAVVPSCAECRKDATVHCIKCALDFCSDCSWKIHEFRVFRSHRREALGAKATVSQPATPAASKPATQPAVSKPIQAKAEVVESDDEDDAVSKPVALKTPVVRPMPKTELSDSSDSEDEDMTPAPVAKPAAAPVVALSESSESEDEEEVAAPKTTVVRPSPKTELSDSSESEDEEVAPAAMAPAAELSDSSDSEDEAPAPIRPAESSDESSDESDVEVKKPASKAVAGASTHSVVKKIEAYAASAATEALHLSPSLNSYERLLAHDCAESLGLAHESVGEGLERHITISKSTAKPKAKKSWSKSRA
ncbi:hypothetical protein ACHHYP_09217 [Achlya hypogyna]|uniref:Uncharacterized protein n=1 Tax=Achlya hypogyna TaxID=1202772 RepID=A0A1V9ZJE5_ACHHY|nr:hypothetical protein ACHHYP_09217 [Achlya hypogyna]